MFLISKPKQDQGLELSTTSSENCLGELAAALRRIKVPCEPISHRVETETLQVHLSMRPSPGVQLCAVESLKRVRAASG